MPNDPQAPRGTHPTNPLEPDDFDDADERCSWCGGEGYQFGDEFGDPGWYIADEMYPCPSCRGSGLRKDMVLG